MNQKQKQQRVNEALRFLDPMKKHDVNCIKINTHNTFEHELAKFEECWKLALAGHSFVTEGIFKSGGRADIIDLEKMQIIEILVSETESKFNEKVKNYPKEFEIFKVKR